MRTGLLTLGAIVTVAGLALLLARLAAIADWPAERGTQLATAGMALMILSRSVRGR